VTTDDASSDRLTYKVERDIERYGLEGMGSELERRWLGIDGEESSLRELADYFNRELLSAVLLRSGQQPIEGEVENLYRLLTDDAVSSGNRTQARRTLERYDVDVGEVESDFVTHQAVHTYLTNGRDVRKEPAETDRLATAQDTIERLKSRTSAVTERSLEQLRNGDDIVLDDFTVVTEVSVTCSECGAWKPVSELLEDDGCECDR
jgi:hypothetical protein